MLLEAAREHGLDLARCWMIGDQARDTLAGQRAGCRGSLLLRTGQGRDFLARTAEYDHACDDLAAAADWILAADRDRGDD
jgi:D-glycero-D-manno-heptose 1,7-bisphosphate phosphatase